MEAQLAQDLGVRDVVAKQVFCVSQRTGWTRIVGLAEVCASPHSGATCDTAQAYVAEHVVYAPDRAI